MSCEILERLARSAYEARAKGKGWKKYEELPESSKQDLRLQARAVAEELLKIWAERITEQEANDAETVRHNR